MGDKDQEEKEEAQPLVVPDEPDGGTEFPPDGDSSALNDPEEEESVPEKEEADG